MAENIQYHELALPVGQIRGCISKTIYDETYYSFEGIPYAEPPVGDLRFKSPLPAKPWAGVKDCLELKVKPIQKDYIEGGVGGSEDCLYLNVFAKKLDTKKPLPVMFWIYGGGFNFGEATRTLHSPDYLMQEDVIVVTLNYRVHALGFLSLEDPELQVPGNAGLKDQILALKWVKQYIKHFNGDSENITVFGCSAGGASTQYLLAAKPAKGLFHKAISMSGSSLNFWSNNPQKGRPYRLAVANGYTGENNDRKVLEFLQSLEVNKLIEHEVLTDEERRNGVLFPFCPCVEPYEADDCVISQEPEEMLKTAWGNDIPIIMGVCVDEGLLYYPQLKLSPETMNTINDDLATLVPLEVRDENNELTIKKAKKLIKAHFGDKEPSDKCLKEFIEFYGFKAFWHGIHRSLCLRLAHAKADTYLYRFAFDSPTFNQYRTFICSSDLKTGVCHADDMSYLWYSSMAWKLDEASLEYKTIQRVIGFFTTFAKTSNPNCKQLENVKWHPIADNEPDIGLNITNDLEFIVVPEKEKLLEWDSLYDNK